MSATSVGHNPPSERPSASVLWRAAGGRRYASALIVDSLGDGMLRPFVLLYAVLVQGMALPAAGLAGSGTALVAATAPPGRLGHHLARWQLSTGAGRAVAPVLLTGLLAVDPALLWVPLAAVTALGAWFISRHGPYDERDVDPNHLAREMSKRSRPSAPSRPWAMAGGAAS